MSIKSEVRKVSGGELSPKRLLMVQKQLAPYLNQIFGYHALLYTPLAQSLCKDQLSIKHRFVITESSNIKTEGSNNNELSLLCHFEELPFSSDTVDLAVLPNILQDSTDPHQVLREVERVLIPEGTVILIGRNPYSWQGINNAFSRWRKSSKPTVADISKRRIKDWFGLLGFATDHQINISLSNQKVQQSKSYSWLKNLADYFCRYFCSYYIIIATKKVSTLTPIRPSWRSNKQLVSPRIAEPSVRTQVENMFVRIKD